MVKNKDRWSALSMSERADLIKLYVSNGITSLNDIKRDYNSFGDGGDTNSNDNSSSTAPERKLTLEEYLQAKADSTRSAALESSRNRTEGVEIVYPLSEKSKKNNAYLLEKYYFANPEFVGPILNDQKDSDYRTYWYQAKKELDNNCDYGSNCIGTATDNYPEDSRTNVNKDFRMNASEYGFIGIPYEEMLPGDIVQVGDHGMIFDSFNGSTPTFNYSNGSIGPDAYRKQGRYPADYYSVFRYVGTPALIRQWTEEYNAQNKKLGGKLNKFAPGGPIKVDEYGYPADITPSIIEADYPRENEVWKRADASNADMVQRLKQGSSRATIQDWEDPRKVATHKMMSAGNYVVGNVQNINGQLFDFTDPKHGFENPDRAAIDSAIKRGDYIKFDTEGDARYFAEHYKKHYNSFGDGGEKEPLYYDNTPIEPAVIKAFNSQEDYNRYYGEQFGKQILKKRDDLLGTYDHLFDPQKIADNVPARQWGPMIVTDENVLVMPGTNIVKAPIQYLVGKNTGKNNIELAKQIIDDFEAREDKQKHIDENSNYYMAYIDAKAYLDHAEGLKKYLGLPYDNNSIKESAHKPTRLQGTDEKTYKFTSQESPKYWKDVVEDMVLGEQKEHQYYDPTLNTFTAYRDIDNKGDFISIYDEWDYNPSVQGGSKHLNKIIDVATGGNPFIVYDRIYLDDYYDVPEAFRGNPYITPAVVTAESKKANGGKLSLLNNSFDDGGNTNPTTTIKPLSYVDVMLKTAQSRTKLNSTEPPEEPLPPNTKIIIDSNGNEVFVRTEEPIQDVTSSIMEWAPGIGDVYELGLIGNDFNHGNYGSAALGAGLLFLPGNARKLIDKGKNLLGLNSRKAAKIATEKVKALLKRFPKGMDSPSHFSESLKERLLKEGVDPTLLTDDNLKKMTYLRSQDILESAAPSKFAARESSSGINMYNLYNTVDGNVTQVGYINAVPNPQEKSGRIAMVENVTQGSRKPVKGVSELGYNTVIKDLGASENGRVLLHPESTVPVLNKYEDKAIIGNYGVWYNSGSQTLGNPVYRLNTPTYDVPIKYLDDFSVEGLDDSGMFLFDFTKGPLLKNGGKLNKFDYGGNVESYNPYTDINPLMEEDSENGKYYRELMQFAVNNPETFWNDSKNSVAAREWLRKNSPADLTSLYWNTDDAFRKTIDKRFIPKEALQQETKDRYYKSMDKTSKGVALTLGASAIAPWAISGGIAAYTNPVTKSIIDLAGSIDGIRNAASKNGVRKTIRLAKEGDVWGTTKSAIGDIFDIAGGIGLAGDVYRYGKGASKRLAEAVVRIGDNARSVSAIKEQILNKKALNYIFNPYADPNLAYNLPYTYSGVGIGEEAYKGDVVDKFFRKVPVVDSLDPDSIPSGLKSYISDVYPHKDIKYIDLGSVKPFGDYKKKVLQSLQTGESIKYGEKSGGIYKRVGFFSRPVLDPGGFNSVYKREGNDLIHEGFDIWKFNADDYMKRYSPTTEISTNKKPKLNDFIQKYKLQKIIPRLGLKFIDSMGDPIVHKFTYTYPNFYK